MKPVIDIVDVAALQRKMPRFLWGAGFSFIELVIVIILVGILSVVAMPKLSLMSGYNDVGYRDQIKATVGYARKAAVAMRRYTCVITEADSKVTLLVERLTTDAHTGNCPAVADTTFLVLNLPSGTNFISPPKNVTVTPATTIQFNAEGSPTQGGGTILTITDSGSTSSSTLTIEAGTGYVH